MREDVAHVAAIARAVEGRVVALTRAHTLLAEGGWTGAELHLLERAGHAPHEQQPALVAGIIRDFVAER